MSNDIFMIGDPVFYVGERHRQELNGRRGWIHAQVINQPNSYVVWFPETKEDDSYILSGRLLTRVRPAPDKKHDGPEIMPRRKKKEDV
jgi:hypothetical protein